MNKPFKVQVDSKGCNVCGSNKTWGVTNTLDDSTLGVAYEDKRDARWLANQLNEAFEDGYNQGLQVGLTVRKG